MTNGANQPPQPTIPKEVQDYYNKGVEAVKRENYGYAVELFGSALALKQDFGEARYYLWLSLWEKQKRQSDPIKIKATLAKVLGALLMLRAVARKKSGRTWEAIYQLEKAMKVNPSDTAILKAMADCFLSEGQTLNAIKILEGVPQIDKGDSGALKKIAQLYRKLENYEKARAFYQATLRVNPNDIDAERGIKDLDAIKTLDRHFST